MSHSCMHDSTYGNSYNECLSISGEQLSNKRLHDTSSRLPGSECYIYLDVGASHVFQVLYNALWLPINGNLGQT